MSNSTQQQNKIYNWFRIIGIPAIGILMPLIFYDGDDLTRLFKWMIVSLFLTFFFWEVGQNVSNRINSRYPIDSLPGKHLIFMLLFFSGLSISAILFVYLVNTLFGQVSTEYWQEMKGIHIIIVLITFFITAIHEGIFLFFNWKNSLFLTEKLEKENILAHYEALKNQVNPHFLFNSLDVLSSLIQTDSENATEYVDQFSKTYRYILDVSNRDIVTVAEEMDFIHSYVYLHKIRFGENLAFTPDIEDVTLKKYIVPLSIQILVENAIKHNIISDAQPLKIEIVNDEKSLIIKNNLNIKKTENTTHPIGLKNLAERYRFMSESKPVFYSMNNEFVAEIPFITEDQ